MQGLSNIFGACPEAINDKAKLWGEAYTALTGQTKFVPQEIVAMWAAEHHLANIAHSMPPASAFTQPGQSSPVAPQPVQPQPPQQPVEQHQEEEGPLDFTGMNTDSMAPAYFDSAPSQQLTLTRLTEIVANGQPVPATFVHPQTNRLANGMIVGQQGGLAKIATLIDAVGNQEAVFVAPENIQA